MYVGSMKYGCAGESMGKHLHKGEQREKKVPN